MKIFIITFFILFVGCKLRFNKEVSNTNKTQNVEQLINSEQLYQIKPSKQGFYSLEIKKYKDSSSILRVSNSGSEKLLSFGENNTIMDSNLPNGETYNYIYGYIHNGEFIRLHTVEVEIPHDLILDEVEEFVDTSLLENKDNKYLRLFLNNTVLITNGNNTVINFKEIISNESSIDTFKVNQKAKDNTNGRNGGHIIIKAQKIIGELTVNMRGEHGGNRVNESVWNNSTINNESCVVNPVEKTAKIICLEYSDPVLLYGLNGGDTGDFEIVVNNSENFKLTVNKSIGVGSMGRRLYTATTELPLYKVKNKSSLKIVAEASPKLVNRFLQHGWCKVLNTWPYANLYYCDNLLGNNGFNGKEGQVCTKFGNNAEECR